MQFQAIFLKNEEVTPGKVGRMKTGTGKGVERLLYNREISCLWPLILGREENSMTGPLGDKSVRED